MRSARLIGLVVAVSLFVACSGDSNAGTTTSELPDDSTIPTPTTTTESGNTTLAAVGEPTITISNFQFMGATAVATGETLTVTNEDGVTHTWTSDDDVFDSGSLASGESFEFTFEDPGEYTFFCAIHPAAMTGSITVEG